MKSFGPWCAILLGWLAGCAAHESRVEPPQPPPAVAERMELLVGTHRLSVRVADDPVEHARGLAGVSELGDGEGMLFIYESSELRSFWMKGCLISLDIAFVTEDGQVLDVVTLPPPRPGDLPDHLPRAESEGPARYVLETRGGWWRDRGLGDQTQVKFPEMAR